jgi:hypothetical protein
MSFLCLARSRPGEPTGLPGPAAGQAEEIEVESADDRTAPVDGTCPEVTIDTTHTEGRHGSQYSNMFTTLLATSHLVLVLLVLVPPNALAQMQAMLPDGRTAVLVLCDNTASVMNEVGVRAPRMPLLLH